MQEMKFNPDVHHRRSLRLKEYDYSTDGAYFVTICSYKKECIFENSDINKIIEETWNLIPEHFPSVILDEFIIMPNHLHGILWIMKIWPSKNEPQKCRGEPCVRPNNPNRADALNRAETSSAPTLGRIVQMFKSKTLVEYINLMKSKKKPYLQKIWQRNYYEHIIRNDRELYTIRGYIKYNPLTWDTDEENPVSKSV